MIQVMVSMFFHIIGPFPGFLKLYGTSGPGKLKRMAIVAVLFRAAQWYDDPVIGFIKDRKFRECIMIRVTIWYENVQESGVLPEELRAGRSQEDAEHFSRFLEENCVRVRSQYPSGVMGTLADYLRNEPDLEVTYVTLQMPEYGLTQDLLDRTDVLIWWSHVAQEMVPDEIAYRVVRRVQAGMGFIPLHSAHKSKPFMYLLGTTGTLKWREGDFCRVWTAAPAHPIARGIPESIELSEEEMYGEPFDIPKPDETVFISWFSGGEVFRSGCTWSRGYGKIFYFQPGHETSPSYHNPYILRIILNAVRWAAPEVMRENFDCPKIVESPEEKRRGGR